MIIVGVAVVEERYTFYSTKVRPSLLAKADRVYVKQDWMDGGMIPEWEIVYPSDFYGDAGKFEGLQKVEEKDFYYFSCDDDLVYSEEYFDHMIEAIERYDRKAVVCLHGSTFAKFPIESYYKDKYGPHCLHPQYSSVRVLFPGTGVTAFHSSLFTQEERKNFLENFPIPNMADIWMGILLQRKKIPAVAIPHNGDLLQYNHDLPLEDTIWGKHHKDDFIQTAIVNQFSLNPGFELPPLPSRQG